MAYAVKDTHDAAEVDIPDSIHFPDIRLTMLCTGGELCIHRALPERDDAAGCRQLRTNRTRTAGCTTARRRPRNEGISARALHVHRSAVFQAFLRVPSRPCC